MKNFVGSTGIYVMETQFLRIIFFYNEEICMQVSRPLLYYVITTQME